MFSDRSLARVADYDMLLNSYPLVSLQTPSLSVKQLWGETIAYIAYVPNSQCWWLLIDWYWLPTCVLQCGSLLSQGLTVLPGHWFGFSCDALVRFLSLDFRCVLQCSLPLLWNFLGTYNATCYPFKDKSYFVLRISNSFHHPQVWKSSWPACRTGRNRRSLNHGNFDDGQLTMA